MRGIRNMVIRAGLDALHYTGAQRWLQPFSRGSGIVFMLHHIRPDRGHEFAPNRMLEVTPDFLDAVISRVKEAGYDLVGMEDVPARLASGPDARPFAVFTIDDGYRDNLVHAAPVFRRHDCPYTIYFTTDFLDGVGHLWWIGVEEAIRRLDEVTCTIEGARRTMATRNQPEKMDIYSTIRASLRMMSEQQCREEVRAICAAADICLESICREQCLNWEELEAFAASDTLLTVGAHTISHPMLARLSDEDARDEIFRSRQILEARLGRKVQHFAYPTGDSGAAGPREFALVREAGYRTGVTTRRGQLHGDSASKLECLPRVSLNGHFQSMRYVDLFISGAPFAIRNAFRQAATA